MTLLAAIIGAILFYLAAWYMGERFGIIWLPVAVIAGSTVAYLVG